MVRPRSQDYRIKVQNFMVRDAPPEIRFLNPEQSDLRFNDSHWVSDFEQETSQNTREAKA